MAIKLLVGRAGSGKTHHILEEICQACAADPFGAPIILVVPEQASYQAEKAILSHGTLRGYTRAQVLSFTRLAEYVHAQGPAPGLPPITTKHRELLAILLVHRWRRERPGTFLDTPGIEESVSHIIAEAHQQAIDAQRLRESLDRLAEDPSQDGPTIARTRMLREKVSIIAELIEQHDDLIRERFQDPSSTLLQVAEAIRTGSVLQGATVYIDSFIDFTPVEEALIAAIARRAARTVLSVQLEPRRLGLVHSTRGGSHPIFGSTESGLQRLFGLLKTNGISLDDAVLLPSSDAPTRHRRSALRTLERDFLAGAPATTGIAEGVRLVEATSPREEARLAAEVAAQALREHPEWSPADIAILTRDLAAYGDDLARHLAELRVPHFVDLAAPLQTHPFVVGIRALLAAAQNPGASEHLVELGKSGLLPIPRDEVDFLDFHVRQYPRSRAEWLSDRPWHAPVSRSFDEDEPTVQDLFTGTADAARRLITAPVRALQAALRPDADGLLSFLHFVRSLLAVLSSSIQIEQLSATDRRILGRLGELIGQATDVVGEESLPIDLCIQIIQQALAGLQLPRIPPLLDQVFVGQVDRSRQPAVRLAVVVGLSEGLFPRPATNRTLLNDAERDLLSELDIDLKPGARRLFQREALFGYRAFSAPSEELVLIRPRGTNDGGPLPPSPYWMEVERLLGLNPHQAESLQDPSRCWRAREMALSTLLATDSDDVGLVAKWLDELANTPSVLRVFHAHGWANSVEVPRDLLESYLRRELRLSATQLDTYGSCPYQFFLRHVLRPHEMILPEFNTMDAGNYAHRVLEVFSRIVRERDLLPLHDDAVIGAAIEESITGPELALQETGLLASASGEFLHLRLNETLRAMCQWMVEIWRGVRARPIAEEQSFRWPIQHLVPVPGWNATLSGTIDRLDAATTPDGRQFNLIVDYKLSSRQFEFGKWIGGLSSQLPVYLLALENALAGERTAAGAVYLEIIPKVDKGKEGRRQYRGIIGTDGLASIFGSIPAKASDAPGFDIRSPDPDSSKSGGGSVVATEDLQSIQAETELMIRRFISGIVEARFPVAPSRFHDETACARCSRQRVCRMDYAVDDVVRIPGRSAGQVISQLRRRGEPTASE